MATIKHKHIKKAIAKVLNRTEDHPNVGAAYLKYNALAAPERMDQINSDLADMDLDGSDPCAALFPDDIAATAVGTDGLWDSGDDDDDGPDASDDSEEADFQRIMDALLAAAPNETGMGLRETEVQPG